MCTNPNNVAKEIPPTLNNLIERVERFYHGNQEFKENYKGVFSITGGEPTLSPYLFLSIKKINELFPGTKIICLTNGRMFSYVDYAKEFLQLDANLEIAISIHGHNAKLHDRISQTPGSFLETLRGLENILRFKKFGLVIEVRIVIHKLNYKFLENITRFIKNEFPQVNRFVYIFFEIEGQAEKNIKALKLTYTQLLPYITKIYNLISYFSDTRFYHFPLCTLPVKFFPYIWRTLPKFEVAFLKTCKDCNLKKLCLGIHKGYLKHIGTSEFQPIKDSLDIKEDSNWHHPIMSINL